MKNNKREEKRRKKFRTLILLLFLTIIMFGTSTYAWFTANQLVTINNINVHVESTGGIQISTNATNWKSVITTTDISTGYHYDLGNNQSLDAVNQLPADLTAVSTDAVPVTDNASPYKGRLNMYAPTIATDSGGAYTLATTIDREVGGTNGAASTSGKFIVFDIFLRLDAQRTVYLTSDSDVVLSSSESEERGLKNSARAAFVYLGNMVSSTAPATLAGMNDPLSTDGVILWEPNVDAHTATVVTSVAPEYGVTLTSNGNGGYNAVTYYGVNQEISPAQSLIGTVNPDHTTLGDSNGTTQMVPNIQTKTGNGELKVFKSNMPAGVSKYRVYLWIEGQDIDCENGATGSNITYSIKLTTTGPASSSSGE